MTSLQHIKRNKPPPPSLSLPCHPKMSVARSRNMVVMAVMVSTSIALLMLGFLGGGLAKSLNPQPIMTTRIQRAMVVDTITTIMFG